MDITSRQATQVSRGWQLLRYKIVVGIPHTDPDSNLARVYNAPMDQSATNVWRRQHGVAPKAQAVLIFSTASTVFTKLRSVLQAHAVGYSEPGINSLLVSAESGLLTQAIQHWRKLLSVEEFRDVRAAIFESRTPSAEDIARAPLLLSDLDVAISLMDTRWLVQLLASESHFVVFQPLVSLASRQVVAYECLLRGRRQGAEIGSAQLFAAAQSLGIGFHLEHLAWQRAISQGQELARRGYWLFLNFSPTAASDEIFAVEQTSRICAQHGVDLKQIVFEVTEAEKDYDAEHLRTMMREYRTAGAKFALDDLGSGHSSVLRLASIRPDFVKIDAGLVRGAHAHQSQAVFMKAISEAAHQLDISVVAEGVETADDLKHCIAIGADLVQGYYLARPAETAPMVSEEAMHLLEQWTHQT
jgi:EAL domain-containing protein (putative c-di-GMP-specific phosphodiesterase class I)